MKRHTKETGKKLEGIRKDIGMELELYWKGTRRQMEWHSKETGRTLEGIRKDIGKEMEFYWKRTGGKWKGTRKKLKRHWKALVKI